MPAGTLAIVLVAAVAHAIWNTISKCKRGDTVVFVWAYTLASALLCVPVGGVLVARGAQRAGWALAVGCLVSALMHVAYSLTLQTGYDLSDLTVVYPIARGTGPVLTMLAAIALLGERPGRTAVLGALLVVTGIGVVAGNPWRSHPKHPLRGVGWGAATGVMIAGYTLWDSHCVTSLRLEPMSYFAGALLAQTLLLTPGAFRRRDRIRLTVRADAVVILVVAVLSPLAYVLVLTAMRTAPVALVAPLRESSIVVGSLLAWRLFHEDHLARRLAGAAIVLAGIAAISL